MTEPEYVHDADWAGQYVIGLEAPTLPPWFIRYDVGGVVVAAAPDVATVPIVDRDGIAVGIVLGMLVEQDRDRLVADSVRVDRAWTSPQFLAAVESHLYGLSGSFLFVVAVPGARRVYLDANGTLPIVHHQEQRVAASSAGLILDAESYRAAFEGELYRSVDVERAGWFPSTLTAHTAIRRLLCNHYLDLDAWRASRCWPPSGFEPGGDGRQLAYSIGDRTRRSFAVISSNFDAAASLTAGHETRFLLAAARPFASSIEWVTVASPDTRLDVDIARRLARRFDVPHRSLPVRLATTDRQAEWMFVGGHCVGGTNRVTHPTLEHLTDREVLVTGLGGEIGRAFFWKSTDNDTMRLDARGICGRFGMPIQRQFVDATDEWLDGVQGFSSLLQLDLAYMELRMSAWAYANPFGSGRLIPHVAPMISRPNYEEMLRLPAEHKRSGRFIYEYIRRAWPELLEQPINRYGGLRDVRALGRKIADPHRVLRKLRKLRG